MTSSSAAARNAFWGFEVVDPNTQKTEFAANELKFFAPASNTKLFTTALAFQRLGADYRFETRVLAPSAPDAAGRIRGDLVFMGGGDPTLSGRAYPYERDGPKAYPLRGIEELAEALVTRGIKTVDGGVVGDDTAYVWSPYPDGWTQDDEMWEYGAPVSALTVNDNIFTLLLRPGDAVGDLAVPTLNPALEYLRLLNRVETTRSKTERRIHIDRAPGSRELVVWGSMPRGAEAWSQLLAIDDPALYAATALQDALTRRGVSITGSPSARHLVLEDVTDLERGPAPPSPAGVVLAQRTSPPLAEIAQVVNKVSQNLHAEILLREVGRRRRGLGSREAGLKELQTFLAEIGIPKEAYQFEDGSGLSRLTLVTPRALTTLLGYMYRSRNRDAWMATLPIGGEDGTLSNRFEKRPEGKRILAKTGSLSHVAALSGYGLRPGGSTVAFSLLVNNYNAPSAEVRRVMDRLALAVTGTLK